MNELLRRAERLKLARALDCAPERLEFLDTLAPLDLRRLREAATQSLLDQHRELFHRIALSGRLLPAAVTARLSMQVFGPMISARVAGMLDPNRAVKVSARLPAEFQADLSLFLDPQSAPEVLRRMPIALVADVARVLAARAEHITMARFVDHLSETAIRAVVGKLDDEALTRIAIFVENENRLSQLIAGLPPERLRGTVRASHAGDAELQRAGVALLCRVSDPVKGRLGDAAAQEGDALLGDFVRHLREAGADAALAATLAHMSAPHRARAEALSLDTPAPRATRDERS